MCVLIKFYYMFHSLLDRFTKLLFIDLQNYYLFTCVFCVHCKCTSLRDCYYKAIPWSSSKLCDHLVNYVCSNSAIITLCQFIRKQSLVIINVYMYVYAWSSRMRVWKSFLFQFLNFYQVECDVWSTLARQVSDFLSFFKYGSPIFSCVLKSAGLSFFFYSFSDLAGSQHSIYSCVMCSPIFFQL